jgi:predicted amidophosphoribosyltransferase
VLDVLRSWLFPPVCVACERPGPALCAACSPRPQDAVTFELDGVPAFALGEYAGSLRRAIVAMKRGERDPLDTFAALLAERVAFADPLIPLPTSRGRANQRGFDQSVELGRRLAFRGVATSIEALDKRGGAQAGRGRAERLDTAQRFRVCRDVTLPAQATILDDVCTTGATARDAVRALRAAGVDVRRCLFLARTPP